MPVTDPASARERAAQLAAGWPDYVDWHPSPTVEARLDALCAAYRQAKQYRWGAVTDPAPPEVAETYDALRAGLVDAGLPQRLGGLGGRQHVAPRPHDRHRVCAVDRHPEASRMGAVLNGRNRPRSQPQGADRGGGGMQGCRGEPLRGGGQPIIRIDDLA